MNEAKWSRLSLVVHSETAKDLALIAALSDSSVSKVVRDLITEPAAVMAEHLGIFTRDRSPEAVQKIEEQVDAFVDSKYDTYRSVREGSK